MFILVYVIQYYAESHAVIYIVDSSDRERIDESKTSFGMLTSSQSLVELFLWSQWVILGSNFLADLTVKYTWHEHNL